MKKKLPPTCVGKQCPLLKKTCVEEDCAMYLDSMARCVVEVANLNIYCLTQEIGKITENPWILERAFEKQMEYEEKRKMEEKKEKQRLLVEENRD